MIDLNSLNGKGGHFVISTKCEKTVLTNEVCEDKIDTSTKLISGDGGDKKKSDFKKYHLKLVLKNDRVSIKHQFTEIAHYLMYQNFGYEPETFVIM